MEEETGFWHSYENGFTRWLERLQGNPGEDALVEQAAALQAAQEAANAAGVEFVPESAGFFVSIFSALLWLVSNLIEAFYNIAFAIFHPSLWLDWVSWTGTTEEKASLMRFIYYGASVELFFVILTLFLILTVVGMASNRVMWGSVRLFEKFANTIGRIAAWAGLVMVLHQILIIFMQRIFTAAEISLGFGKVFTRDVSWWAEALKLENAIIVTLCATYTFVQGSHVRVDLVYSAVGFRTKRVIDMFGSIFFMMPAAVLVWLYGWFFMWRHLVVPNPSASDSFEKLMNKARALRWNIEYTGFSPNGFDYYWLFKLLLITFAGLVFIHAWAFFFRSYLEWKEGPESEGKFLDKDDLGDADAELVANIH